jgi:uncharacterized iron-regulated membrane protein
MKIEIKTPTPSIPDMLRKLDAQRITSNDIETLAVIRNFLTELREPLSANALTYLFPQEIRAALASAVSDAVVGIINTKLTGKTDGRRLAPEVAEQREQRKRDLLDVHAFKGRIASLSDALVTFGTLSKKIIDGDMEYRQQNLPPLMTPVIEATMELQAAAKGGAQSFDTDTNEMVQQTLPRFEAMVTNIMNAATLSGTFVFAKSTTIINWQATLRSLTRDATDRIRQLKG